MGHGWAMLTYLDGSTAKYLGQGAQRFPAVALQARGAQPVARAAHFGPGEVVHNGEALPPEDGGTVGHGEDARVDEAFERRRPGIARPKG
jgi:hypothetical protein